MSKLKTNSGLLSSGAITEEAMMAYLSGELSAGDKAQFEKLLAEDPFAQDALEGLQSLSQPAAAQPVIDALQTKVHERAGLKETKAINLHWATYAWAAAVVGLLVGVGVLMINMLGNKDDALAENKEAAPTETTLFETQTQETKLEQGLLPATDSSLLNSELSNKGAALQESPSEVVVAADQEDLVSKKPALKDETQPQASAPAAPAVAGVSKVAETAALEEQKVVAAQNRSKALSETNAKKESVEAMGDAMVVSASKSKPSVSVDDAMKEFNSGNYKKASEQFDVLLKNQPENAEALYFGGISDYINGNTKKSEKNFDKLLSGSKGYVEGSKWYKANILLKKGKKEEAKKLLQDLSQTNGSYKERAVKKLAEVQ
jgi:tetratricopeptide (TPR) repeat protein